MGSLHFKSGAQQKFLNLSVPKSQKKVWLVQSKRFAAFAPPIEDASYCESFPGMWFFCPRPWSLNSSTLYTARLATNIIHTLCPVQFSSFPGGEPCKTKLPMSLLLLEACCVFCETVVTIGTCVDGCMRTVGATEANELLSSPKIGTAHTAREQSRACLQRRLSAHAMSVAVGSLNENAYDAFCAHNSNA